MTQEAQLKACPFCGSVKAVIYEAEDVGGYVVHCLTGCGAQTWGSTYEHAVEAWSTRTPDSAIAELKEYVVAFGAPWAAQYSRDFGLPEGHLHPRHYDILEKCGARLDGFARAKLEVSK